MCACVEKAFGSIRCEAVGTSLVLSCLLLRIATEREGLGDGEAARTYQFDMTDKNKVCRA